MQVVPRDVAGGMRPSDCHATDCKFEERLLEKTAAVDAHNGDDDGDDDDDDDDDDDEDDDDDGDDDDDDDDNDDDDDDNKWQNPSNKKITKW